MLTDPVGINALTRAIIGCGIRVHREFGPGLFENVYNECLQWELRDQGLRFERERRVPKLTGLPVGLLMNFNVVTLTDDGVKRVVNPPDLRYP